LKTTAPRPFPAVAELAAQAEEAARQTVDPLAPIVHAVATALHAEADPYVLLGILVESMARTLCAVPPSRRSMALQASAAMLCKRIADHERDADTQDPTFRPGG